MRICMILDEPFPPIDERPYKEAKSLIRAGHHVSLVCRKQGNQSAVDSLDEIDIRRVQPIPYVPYLTASQGILQSRFLVPTMLRMAHSRAEFDAIHIHNPPDSLILSSLSYPHCHSTVFDVHDPVIPSVTDESHSLLGTSAALFWERLALRTAARILVVSEGSERRLRCLNVPKEKIVVVRNYVDLDTFSKARADPASVRRRYGLENQRVILYSGNISPVRGVDLLVEAFAEVSEDYENAVLMIVGNLSSYSESLREFARRRSVHDRVIFVPWQPYEQMPSFMEAADICVEPRRLTYHTAVTGNPNKLFQYMAMEKAIVASNVESISSFVDRTSAILVKPGDPRELARGLRIALQDPQLCRRIAGRAHSLAVEFFNWAKEETKLIQTYACLGRS
jgi:glycosyltransferase involved in cell wall biosynthesis